MQITKITVSYQETANLGNYSNIKPSVTFDVVMESGDNAITLAEQAMAKARRIVQEQVDDALEANDRPAMHSTAPRYSVWSRSYRRKDGLPTLIVVLPAGVVLGRELMYRTEGGAFRKQAALRIAQQHAHASRDGAQVLDLTETDPSVWLEWQTRIEAEDAAIEDARRQMEAEREARWVREHAARAALARQTDVVQEGGEEMTDPDVDILGGNGG